MFNGKNNNEWAYPETKVIGRAKILGFVDEKIK